MVILRETLQDMRQELLDAGVNATLLVYLVYLESLVEFKIQEARDNHNIRAEVLEIVEDLQITLRGRRDR